MRKIIFLIGFAVIFTSCIKPKQATVTTPAKAVLLLPVHNESCISGKVISATESKVIFKWNSSVNTDSYDLTIKNLETGVVKEISTASTEFEMTILRNTPYSWFITSKSLKTTEKGTSDIWKFYNSGIGVVSHPPYPAEAFSPLLGQNIPSSNGKIAVDWTGSDTDGDLKNYDVYFGSTTSVALIKSNVTESIFTDISVNSNMVYYWKIISRDSNGNTSDSGLLNFKTN